MFVLPESPVGLAALMGSSAAALGAFVFIRRSRQQVTPSDSDSDLAEV